MGHSERSHKKHLLSLPIAYFSQNAQTGRYIFLWGGVWGKRVAHSTVYTGGIRPVERGTTRFLATFLRSTAYQEGANGSSLVNSENCTFFSSKDPFSVFFPRARKTFQNFLCEICNGQNCCDASNVTNGAVSSLAGSLCCGGSIFWQQFASEDFVVVSVEI